MTRICIQRRWKFVALPMAFILVVAATGPSQATYQTQAFPAAHELFSPLQADPTELNFGFSFGFPVGYHDIANVDAGDYLGLYRVALGQDGAVQLNIGGAVNSRFDATVDHNLQVIDYYGNVPIDLRLGKFSARSMFYHDSSHLGDDLLRVEGIEDQNSSWNALREIMSYQLFTPFRVYGGYTWAVSTKPAWSGRQAVQGGAELFINNSPRAFLHPYWANDFQAWQRSNWDLTWTSQLGFKTGDDYTRGRGISYYVQFQTGPRYQGQFYPVKETIWGVGLKFSLFRSLSPTRRSTQTGRHVRGSGSDGFQCDATEFSGPYLKRRTKMKIKIRAVPTAIHERLFDNANVQENDFDRPSKSPWAPKGPGTDFHRLSCRLGDTGLSVCCALNPMRASTQSANQGSDFVSPDCFVGGKADEVLSPVMMGGVENRFSGDLGFVNRRYGLRMVGQSAFNPVKLWRVDRGHLHHRHLHLTFIVLKFNAKRIRKSPNRKFSGAVRRLERNGPGRPVPTPLEQSSRDCAAASVVRRPRFRRRSRGR